MRKVEYHTPREKRFARGGFLWGLIIGIPLGILVGILL